jgi:hypothetical protein
MSRTAFRLTTVACAVVMAPVLLAAHPAGADLYYNLSARGDMCPDASHVFSVNLSVAKLDYTDPLRRDVAAGSISFVGGLQSSGFCIYTNAADLEVWRVRQYWHARIVSQQFTYEDPVTHVQSYAKAVIECTQFGTKGQLSFRVVTTPANGQPPDITLYEATPDHPLEVGTLAISVTTR